ncbi:hypothetical protein ILYODFUR_019285, partial [Ilyodon furcidens]
GGKPVSISSRRRGTPWTGHRSIAGQHRHIHSFTPKGNVERPATLTVMFFWTVEGSWRTQREHANSMQKDPQPGVEPRTFLLQGNSATNCTTVQPVKVWRF